MVSKRMFAGDVVPPGCARHEAAIKVTNHARVQGLVAMLIVLGQTYTRQFLRFIDFLGRHFHFNRVEI